jgi:hypothetical protein
MLNQDFHPWRQSRLVQFQGAAHQNLPFGHAPGWQFLQHFSQAHGRKLVGATLVVSLKLAGRRNDKRGD